MAIINTLENTANIVFDGITKTTNTVSTLLSLFPTILKSVDKLTAKLGDILTYTITVENINLTSISNVKISDILPEGCEYVSGSFKVNGTTQTAIYNDTTRELSYTFTSLVSLIPQVCTFQTEIIEIE